MISLSIVVVLLAALWVLWHPEAAHKLYNIVSSRLKKKTPRKSEYDAIHNYPEYRHIVNEAFSATTSTMPDVNTTAITSSAAPNMYPGMLFNTYLSDDIYKYSKYPNPKVYPTSQRRSPR